MPKPFTIGVDIEEIAFGSVIRKLNAIPGIIALHLDFDKEKPPPKATKANGRAESAEAKPTGEKRQRGRPPGQQTQYDMTGDEALASVMRGGKTKTMKDMRDSFAALGRSPHSVNSILHFAQKDGWIKRVGKNAYKLSGRRPKKASSKKG